jgi:hypothetical protein
MAEYTAPLSWLLEYGSELVKPGEPGYNPSWVTRRSNGTARFRCEGHIDTGWGEVG